MVVQEKGAVVEQDLLTTGNSKLGVLLYAFSIPAVLTCPGASGHCREHCYARKGRLRSGLIQDRYQANWRRSRKKRFVSDMVREIRRKFVRVLRVHVAGDMDSPEYVQKWQEIARRSPQTVFLCYTRSWRDPAILPELIKLARLPNWQLWFSEDRETGHAPTVPGIRRAYMCIDSLDERFVPSDVDLVFREDAGDPRIVKKMEGVQVCPVEQGVAYATPMTCSRCGICWREP